MKKLLFTAALAVLGFTSVNAQDDDATNQTAKGKWLIEANTGFGEAHASNTGFGLKSVDGETSWNVGLEGGYFIMDDLAVKAGLGYGQAGNDADGIFSYKLGAKYYVNGNIPVGLDINGASVDGFSPMYVGAQAGYAWFLGQNVSIEPGLRYDFGMNEEAGDGDFNPFSVRIGFALHF